MGDFPLPALNLMAVLMGWLCINSVAGYSFPEENQPLVKAIEVLADTNCSLTVAEAKARWPDEAFALSDFPSEQRYSSQNLQCYWSRLTIENPDLVPHTQVLYFPKGWRSLDCYYQQGNGDFIKKTVGTQHRSETLPLTVSAQDTVRLYVHYPPLSQSYFPTLGVQMFSLDEYQQFETRTIYKYFFLGVIIFPVCFFFAQWLVERERFNFAYWIFLLGAALNLITILEATPYFEYSPKIISSIGVIQRFFVVSVFLTLVGLIKYIHYLLNIKVWSPLPVQIGHWLIGGFFIVILTPFVFPYLFRLGVYESYLPYLRVGALLLVMYILFICIWAAIKRIKYSGVLLLAFAPFILSMLYYALSFVFLGQYSESDIESIILILGFFLTLLLFGVILGVRNNRVKGEKVILEQKTQQLQELDQFKSQFYTNFTHEFRTPLTVIGGIAEQIEGHEREKALIQRNNQRLLNLVNQLLELSRLETNSLSVDWVQGDVISFLRYLTESCSSLADSKQIDLSFSSSHRELLMDYDAGKLQQIIINLLSNAIKFTSEQGSVNVAASSVMERGGEYLQLQVMDTGKGIPKNQLSHIFDRFYQVDSSNTRQDEGSGIGLALVKELVHLLQGRIEVDSEVGKGTTFSVYLPIHHWAGIRPASVPSLLAGLEEKSNSSETVATFDSVLIDNDLPLVLLIEDNADVREYIVSCLQPDFVVKTAANGKAGLEKAWQIIPDVVICDVMMPSMDMPKMDGFAVCQQLKEDRRSSHIPVMMLTAKATQEDRITGFRRGADAYLTKPFHQEELLVRLANLTTLSQRLRDKLKDGEEADEQLNALSQQEARFLQEIDGAIESHLSEPEFDTLQLCREIGMSRTQLHRKLKALTDTSTATYIRTHRLQRAKKLLQSTKDPIGEIAVQVGYKDFSHFSRSFAQEFGYSPSEVRH